MQQRSVTREKAVDRRDFIGGSDARVIMGQDEKALIRLWQEKRGEVGPEDLSTNLIVQLGLVTEDLNRQWYERNTGNAVKDVQCRVKHPVIPWMAATLDGVVSGSGAVYEAKFMLPWSFSEEAAAEKYMAQLGDSALRRGGGHNRGQRCGCRRRQRLDPPGRQPALDDHRHLRHLTRGHRGQLGRLELRQIEEPCARPRRCNSGTIPRCSSGWR
jgi:hypothetical protein